MQFKRYILLYTLIPLLILTIAATYYRFMIINDYIVFYEGECDPYENSCFVGCEDEECNEEYFYTKIERHASGIARLCDDDIVDCEFANMCTHEELQCRIEYCSSDDCDDINVSNMENINS